MRSIFFRLAAAVLGALFIWMLAAGGLNQVSVLKRILAGGIASVFLLYGLGGERVADSVLARMFGVKPTKPPHSSISPTDPFDEDWTETDRE